MKITTPEQLVDALKAALPQALRSVVLYGSAVAGDPIDGVSGCDVLMVAEPLGVSELRALAGPLRAWDKAGHPTPQLFREGELAASADAFPIELLDLQRSRRVLFGDDPIESIDIDPACLRAELEHELRAKLLLLRQCLLTAGDKPKDVAMAITDSLSTFLVLCRAALRLYDTEPPADKAEALAELAGHIGVDTGSFGEAAALRSGEKQARDVDTSSLADRYLGCVEQIVTAVDRHIHGEQT